MKMSNIIYATGMYLEWARVRKSREALQIGLVNVDHGGRRRGDIEARRIAGRKQNDALAARSSVHEQIVAGAKRGVERRRKGGMTERMIRRRRRGESENR